MNSNYKLVYSEILNAWVAVAEHVSARGKKSALRLVTAAALMAGGAVGTGTSLAAPPLITPPAVNQLPTGAQVAAGTVSFSQTQTATAASMAVQQSTNKAIVNWQSFNVGANAKVNITQPNASSVLLSRVQSSDPSQIFGQINANGQVLLLNPNGVYFAPGSRVDVGSFTASTHSISDADFLNGQYRFNRNGATGSILNEGTITSGLGGYIALLAPEVRNQGVVLAQMGGTVALAAGESFELQFNSGKQLTNVLVTPATLQTLVDNGQAVQAPGGLIILSAQAASGLLGGVVKNSGAISATGLVNDGGTIRLSASHKIELAQSSSISADAAQSSAGNGGRIDIITELGNASGITQVDGTISAKAGEQGGDGGFVDTSAARLDIGENTLVTTGAAMGNAGTWLLDPYDVTIVDSGTASGTAYGTGFTAGAASTILSSSINNSLAAGTNVTISTGTATPGGGSANYAANTSGNIFVNGNINWSTSASLTLTANYNINVGTSSSTGSITVPALGTLNLNPGGSGIINDSDNRVSTGKVLMGMASTPTGGLNTGYWNGSAFTTGAATGFNGQINVAPGGTIKINNNAFTVINSETEFRNMPVNSASARYILGRNLAFTTPYTQAVVAPGNSNPFKGDFNGFGHEISGLNINNSTASSNTGLFGNSYADWINSNISNIGVAGNITTTSGNTDSYTGGLIGRLDGDGNSSVFNAYSTTVINAVNGNERYVGGLIGYAGYVTVKNVSAAGAVTANNSVGGLIGSARGARVSYANASGAVTATSTAGGNNSVGGLIGYLNTSDITYSYATGAVNASSTLSNAIGGLAGKLDGGSITYSYATGNVTNAGGGDTGGLVGHSAHVDLYSNVYATGNVQASTAAGFVGGLIAHMYNNGGGTVSYAYTSNTVTGPALSNSNATGGLFGHIGYGSNANAYANGITLTSLYWDSSKNTITAGVGGIMKGATNTTYGSGGNGSGVSPISTVNLKTASNLAGFTFGSAGFGYAGSVNGGLPVLCTLSLCTSFVSSVVAATYNGASGGLWSLSSNWLGGIAPVAGSTVSEAIINSGSTVIYDTANVGSLGFDIKNAGTISFTGSSDVTLSGVISGVGRLTKAGNGTVTLSGANTYTGTTTISAGTLKVGSGHALGNSSGGAISVASLAALDLNGFSLVNTNTLTLNGTGINNGGALTNSGTGVAISNPIVLASDTSIGSSIANLNLSGVISGAGNLTKIGSANSTFSGANTYTGTTTVSGTGILAISHAQGLGSTDGGTIVSSTGRLLINGLNVGAEAITLNGGSLEVQSGTSSLSGAVDLAANSSIRVDSGAQLTLSGLVSGTGRLTKTSGVTVGNYGTLVLTGANTYTGGTTVSAGTLQLGAGGTSGSITGDVTNNATLAFNRSDDVTYAGAISGSGAVTKLAANTLTITGDNSYSGGTTVSAGTLQLGDGSTSGAIAGEVINNGTVVFNRSDAVTHSGVISGTGALTQSGGGTTTLSGANTYTGATTVSAGTLAIIHATGMGGTGTGTTVANGATLDLNAVAVGAEAITLQGGTLATSTGTSSLSGGVTMSANSFVSVAGTQLTLSGVVSGTGFGLTKTGSGSLVLSANNTYSGETTVSAGTLAISHASGLGGTGAGAGTNVASGATLDLRGVAVGAEALTLSGGSLTASTGTSSLSGAVNLTSATLFSGAGALTLSGAITSNGHGLALLGTGAKTLSSTSNTLSTIATGSGVGALNVVNHAAMTIGQVTAGGSTYSGIDATGTVSVVTRTGNLTVSQNVATTSTASNYTTPALKLGAGSLSAAGTPTGGDVVLSGTPTINVGTGGVALIYSGYATTSAARTLNASFSPKLTYYTINADSTYVPTVQTSAYFTLYRESPATLYTLYVPGQRSTYGTPVTSLNYCYSTSASSCAPVTVTGVPSTTQALALNNVLLDAGTYPATISVPAPDVTGYFFRAGNAVNIVVDPKPVTIATTARTTTYNGLSTYSDLANAMTYTVNGLVGFDAVRSVTQSPSGNGLVASQVANAGSFTVTPSTVVLSTGKTSNYAFTYTPATVTVNKADLTVKASNDAKFFGETDANGFAGVSYSGFVAGETASVLSGTATVARSNAGVGAAGTYAGVLSAAGSTLTSNNYNLIYKPGDYTIVPADQLLIRLNDASTTYGTAPSYSLASVQYKSSIGNAVVDLTSRAAVNAGAFTLSDGAGGNTALTLGPLLSSLSSAGQVVAGSYQVGAGSVTNTSDNYSNTVNIVGALTVAQKTLTPVATSGLSKVYDGTTSMSGLGFGLSGVVGADAVTATGLGTYANANAGNAKSFTASGISLGGTDATNYKLAANTLSPTNGVITAAPLLIKANNDSKTYDASAYAATAGVAYSGFVTGETAADLGGTLIYSGTAIGAVNVGNYVITPSGQTSSNYAISFGDGSLYISPADVRVSATNVALTGTVGKVYDGTNVATLTSSNYVISGWQGSDGANITQTTGTYDNANAGTNKLVSVTLASSDFSATNGTLLSNYNLPTAVSGNVGVIYPKTVTVTNAARSNVYDGTSYAALALGTTYSVGAMVGSDAVASITQTPTGLSGSASGAAQAGTFTVTPGAAVLSTGTDSNYNFSYVDSTHTVTPATLAATLTGSSSKVYDGSTSAALTAGNFALTGFVNAEGASVTKTTGTLDNANVGTSKAVTTTLGGSDFAANNGTQLSNYTLPTSVSGSIGSVTPAPLSAALTGNSSKVYDGSIAAALTSANFALTGFVSAEGASVSQTAGTLDTANVGSSKTVTTTLGSSDFAANNGTQLSNYTTPTSASGSIGAVTPAPLSAALTGNSSKVYDGSTAATLAAGNFALTGFVNAEGASVSKTSGTLDTANVGASKTVTTALGIGDFAANSGTLLSNYTTPTSATGSIGSVTPAPLSATLTGNSSKVYDGSTAAALTASNFALTGFVNSEGASVSKSSGTLDTANVGTSKTVTTDLGIGDFAANSGTLLSNYTTPTSASGSIGSVTPAPLAATLTGSSNKVYDGSTAATLTAGNFALTGFVNAEGASVNKTSGTLDNANVGSSKTVTTTLGSSDFAANSGTLLSNYTTPTSASGSIGAVTPAPLSAALTGNSSKVYDGSTAATLTAGNFALTGFVNAEGASVSKTSGSLDTANVGTSKTVTTALGVGDFAANSSTQLSNYTTPTSASGSIGAVTPAPLSAALTGSSSKVYDGSTAAALTASNFALTGFVNAEGASVSKTSGALDNANVGTSKAVTTTLGSSDFAANSGTLLSNYTTPTSATGSIGAVTPAPLAATLTGNSSKVYDGSTAATLAAGNFALTGFVNAEGASVNKSSGTLDTANVGTSKTVTAALGVGDFAANSGTLLSNYTTPTSASGSIGSVTPAPLAATLTGSSNKVYDGSTSAALTAGNFALTGFVNAEGASVTKTTGTLDNANVGTSKAVTTTLGGSDFAANNGTQLSNYTLPTSVSGSIGSVTPAPLSATLTGNSSKVYDGSTAAALTASNFALTGFVNAEGASVSKTSGALDNANVGTSKAVTTTLGSSDFAANSGTLLSNYTTPTSATGSIGAVTPAPLSAALTGNSSKVYDGSTAATLAAGNFALTGFVNAEGASVSKTSGTLDTANVGASKTVTTALGIGDFAANSGTLLSNYTTPTSATGSIGSVTPAPLSATLTGNSSKVYDGSTAAALTAGNFAVTGFVNAEGASVSKTSGALDNANVGTSKAVTTTLGSSDFAANSGTLLSNYTTPTSASGSIGAVTPAPLAATLTGNSSKVYDGSTAATLAAGNFALTGFVNAEGASVNKSSGTLDTANVGTSKTVTAALGSGDFAANSGTLLSNYTTPTSASGSIGAVTPAPLSAALTGNSSKVYDGSTAATLAAGNFALTGFVNAEGASVNKTSGTLDTTNVGTSKTVTAALGVGDFAANSGTLLSNYTTPTSATGSIGAVTPAPLSAALTGNSSKVYDGSTDATLTAGNFALTGFVNAEGASVSKTSGSLDTANVGTSKTVTTALGVGDFAANSSTQLSNYTTPTSASGSIGSVTPAPLSAALTGNSSKVYDGSTAAALTSANFALTGFVNSEGASVSQTAGTLDTANVGSSKTVTTTLGSSDFAANSGTLLSNYTTPTSATGSIGSVTPAPLSAALTGNSSKAYDGSTAATLTAGNFALTGFVNAEGASVNKSSGTLDTANVGTSKTVTTALGIGDFAANSGTLLSNYTTPTSASGSIGSVTPAPLAATLTGSSNKVYDGSTAATLTAGNFALTGFVNAEGASVSKTSGTLDTANVGTSKTVTAALGIGDFAANSGTLLSNYTTPTSATGSIGSVTPAPLSATLTGNSSKVYDGSTAAALTASNFALTGFVNSEGASVSKSSGTLDTANVGTSKAVTTTLGSSDFAANSGTLLSNYTTPTSATGSIGSVTPAPLSAALTGSSSKVYDGSTTATLAAGNFALTGFVNAEGASVSKTSGALDNANVGSSKTVTTTLGSGDFAANSGTLLSNYTTPTSASGSIGAVTPAPLAATLTGNSSKVYDGSTAATLTSANFALTGFVNAEGASVNKSSGTLDTANVGTSKTVTAALGVDDFAANSGTLLSNYTTPTSASGSIGNVTPAPLAATLTGNSSKVYDGSTAATLAAGNFALTGFVNAEGASVNKTSGTLDTANVGTSKTVTAALGSSDFAASSGTQLSNYTLPTSASGSIGSVTPAPLTVSAASANKTYDGTAYKGGNDVAYSGFVNNETAGVLGGTLAYAGSSQGARNAGSYVITPAGLTSSNYAVNFTDGSLSIAPAPLTVTAVTNTKSFDGNVQAQAVPVVSGLKAPDVVINLSEAYADANPGTGKTLSVQSGYQIVDGNNGKNYLVSLVPSQTGEIRALPVAVLAPALAVAPTGNSAPPTLTVLAASSAGASSAGSGSASGAGAGSAGGGSSAGVSVSTISSPSQQVTGLVAVLVPSGTATAGSGLVIALPEQVVAPAATGAAVQVTLPNGEPLPAWVRYDAATQTLVTSAVPAGAFPLSVVVTVGGQSTVVQISESQSNP